MTSKTRKAKPSSRLIKLTVGLLVGTASFMVGANVAMAHHAEITASVTCERIVSWTASSFTGPGANDTRRTNLSVEVSYTTSNGGPFIHLVTGQFIKSNDFQFSGTLPWPAGLPQTITLKVQPLAFWGPNEDLAPPGSARYTTISLPAPCPEETTTTTTVPEETTTTTTVPDDTTTTTTVPEGTTTTTTVPEGTTTTTVPAATTTTTSPPQTTTTTTTPPPVTNSSVAQEPPIPPVLTVPPGSQLPATGESWSGDALTIAFVLLSLGGVMMFARRRPSES